jgi:coiled-coil domain-containing protein 130
MGRYVPPEFEGTTSGNRLHNKNALGNRANKSSQGILTVRFEMPYPIWCTTCPKPTIIGQGVRFNAEKKKIGIYYSTPIYSFRMKHTACGGWIEIRTDPKNTAYVVHEGARKRDTGEDKLLEGEEELKILTEEEREERRNNAFAALEGKVEDKVRLDKAKERIEEIQAIQDEQWEDPYLLNQKLRRNFRAGRHYREKEAAIAGALQDKMSLGIDLLPENEDDARRAAFVDFGAIDPEQAISKAISRPLFSNETMDPDPPPEKTKSKSKSKSSKLKAVQLAEKRRADFAAEIRNNTRARIDPFLSRQPASANTSWKVVGVKRKREGASEGNGNTVMEMREIEGKGDALMRTVDTPVMGTLTTGLVNYDSD